MLIVGIGPMAHTRGRGRRAPARAGDRRDGRRPALGRSRCSRRSSSSRHATASSSRSRTASASAASARASVRTCARPASTPPSTSSGLPDEFIDHATPRADPRGCRLTAAEDRAGRRVAGARHADSRRPADRGAARLAAEHLRERPRTTRSATSMRRRAHRHCAKARRPISNGGRALLCDSVMDVSAAMPADRRVVERVAEDALDAPDAVEVRRGTAVDERPARAEDQAEVDVLGLGHDALVEHELDLLGEPVLDPAAGSRPRTPASIRPRLEHLLRPPWSNPVTLPFLSFSTTSPQLGELVEVLRREEPVGERVRHRVQHVRADLPADELDQLERRHRQAERRERLLDGQRTACPRRPRAASPRTFASRRLTTKPGRVGGEDRVLAEVRARRPRRSTSAASVVCGVLHDLDERHDGDRVEEVEADQALGVLRASTPISSTDSDEVLVARIASSAMIFSISANTCCLTPTSSKTASITQSQSAKSALSVVP